ncbi:transcriptional regulator NrdR [Gehongia tenuis]|uniref:Transcriptional repressor NrdR n=1 Tax=Gehongia tenuis TaxID=2763655 RepID=A0A926D3K9_9FIRM|nr:transcriptional regulator NrdR [Gehongia tenuis]MBC8530872.1 transcriptional repressor NrdR [Gehongia tenuis]
MKCPFCDHEDSRVVDSRPAGDGKAIRRRRECIACGRRFTTLERVAELLPIFVVKKDGTREAFDPEKIKRGLMKACEKRPVALEEIDTVVEEIEHKLVQAGEQEVQSTVIGEMIMERLRKLDEVAYVRFASVYRQFKDINTFMEELNKLLRDPS